MPTGYVYNADTCSEAAPKTFSVSSDSHICLTRYQFAPELITFKLPYLYIQNKTVTEPTLFQADTIKIGKDVAVTETRGPVSIQSRETVVKSHNVEIKAITIERGSKVTFEKRD